MKEGEGTPATLVIFVLCLVFTNSVDFDMLWPKDGMQSIRKNGAISLSCFIAVSLRSRRQMAHCKDDKAFLDFSQSSDHREHKKNALTAIARDVRMIEIGTDL